MGILGKLFKLAQAISSAASSTETKQKSAPAPIPQGAPAADCYSYRGSVEEYFAQILSGCFPELQVYTNDYLAGPGNVPVSFLLYRDDNPILAIIICSSQKYRNKCVTNTVHACQVRNIPVQCYYREFCNQAAYVVDRIQRAI